MSHFILYPRLRKSRENHQILPNKRIIPDDEGGNEKVETLQRLKMRVEREEGETKI